MTPLIGFSGFSKAKRISACSACKTRKRLLRIGITTSDEKKALLLKNTYIVPIDLTSKCNEDIVSVLRTDTANRRTFVALRNYLQINSNIIGKHRNIGSSSLEATFSTHALGESFNKSRHDIAGFALLLSDFDNVLRTAFKIDEHKDEYGTKDSQEKIYMEFVNLIEGGDGFHLIHIVVVKSKDALVDILKVAASTENTKSQPSTGGAISGSHPLKDGFALNIIELAKAFKGDWLLRRIPDSLLDENSLERKRAAILREKQRHNGQTRRL